MTATPERSDGRGLGDTFETIVLGPSTGELIKTAYLSRFTAFASTAPPDLSKISTRAGDYATDEISGLMGRPVVIISAVTSYEKLCPGKQAIVFGVDVRYSMAIAEKFKERGHVAQHLDAQTPRDELRRVIRAFVSGEIKVLTNVNLFSEGFDVPGTYAVLSFRRRNRWGCTCSRLEGHCALRRVSRRHSSSTLLATCFTTACQMPIVNGASTPSHATSANAATHHAYVAASSAAQSTSRA